MIPESPPLIWSIVLNWNGPCETLQCLRSLEQQDYDNLQMLVVDNGSVDDSVSVIHSVFPRLKVLRNKTNLGFAAGANVGIRYALDQGADFVLILNNDLILGEDCVSKLVAQAKKGAGMVTAALYYSDDPDRLWSIGGQINLLNLEKTADARGQLDKGHLPEVLDRMFVPGGATLISRTVLKKVGLYDERFFLYYEDADYSLQAYRNGFKAVVATGAKMWHSVSTSSGGSDSPRERYWMARSSILYFHKNARWWQTPIIVVWRTLSALRTSARLVGKGRKESLSAYWRGIRDGLKETRMLPWT